MIQGPAMVFGLFCLFAGELCAQQTDKNSIEDSPWQVQQHASGASFRGLFVVDAKVAWASGSKGVVLRTTDGGENWETVSPQGANELDFRDVHAFDADNAVLLTAGTPARVYRTQDGGQSWQVCFEDIRPAAFFDAMAFWDAEHGIAFSDPIDGRLLLITTQDAGRTWSELERERQPRTLDHEAGFAASGTCLCVLDDSVWIGLGGERNASELPGARVLVSHDRGQTWSAQTTPMHSGAASGIFSIVFPNHDHGVALGGTYDEPNDETSNICVTDDGGRHWRRPDGPVPRGYRSGVAVRRWQGQTYLIAVGTTGSDVSSDWGNSWSPLGDEPFHAVAFSRDGKTGIAVGSEGRIGVWRDKDR